MELARQCLDVSRLTDPQRGVSANVGVIRGGLRSNVVPDLAEAEIDVRFLTMEDGHWIERSLRGLRPYDAQVKLALSGGLHYPPLERSPAVARVYAEAVAVAAELGLPLSEVASGGASEASFAGALGRPTLDGLGGDGDGAHAEDELAALSPGPVPGRKRRRYHPHPCRRRCSPPPGPGSRWGSPSPPPASPAPRC